MASVDAPRPNNVPYGPFTISIRSISYSSFVALRECEESMPLQKIEIVGSAAAPAFAASTPRIIKLGELSV